jgi:phosphonate transport system permease protein
VAGVLALCLVQLAPAIGRAWEELARIEWGVIAGSFGAFLQPALDAETLGQAARGSIVPVAMAVLATLASFLLAGALAYPGSIAFQLEPERFTGEHASGLLRAARGLLFLAARGLALLMRAVPEVAWVTVTAVFFTIGILPGVLALTLHSTGILARVFIERVDDVPYGSLEQGYSGSRLATMGYVALPRSLRSWGTYTFFQFESNVRAGVVVGMIGVGGLGDMFHSSYSYFAWNRAGTFALAMVLLTVLIDRTSRSLRLARV